MDKVLKALKCFNCREILSNPVLLSCGHMICQKDTQFDDDKVLCSECGIDHENKCFVVVKGFADLIEANLASFDFGTQHKQTRESCDKLKNLVDKNDTLLNDLNYHIHEEIGLLKNRIMLRSEQLKKQIDEITQEMLDGLDKYEGECKIRCGETANGTNFKNMMEKLKEKNEDAKKKWNEWSKILNELKYDEEKCKIIQKDCEKNVKDLAEKLRILKMELFMGKLEIQKDEISFFEEANIAPVLRNKVTLKIL